MLHRDRYLMLEIRQWVCLLMVFAVVTAWAQETQTLRIGGYAAVLQQHDMRELDAEINFALAIKDLVEGVELHAEVQIFDSVVEAREAFQNHEIDAIFCTTVDYFSMIDSVNPDYLYSASRDGQPTITYSLVTNSMNQDILELADLQGKQLTVGVGTELATLILDVELAEEGIQSGESFLKNMHRVRSSETALVDLMFGKTDAALVPTIALEYAQQRNPQAKVMLRTLFESKGYVPGVMALHRDVEQSFLDNVHERFITMHKFESSQRLLELFQAKLIIRVSPEELGGVKDLVAPR